MGRRKEPIEEAGLSMTPLIDIVLLLLIFYIVTTAFIDRELQLQLPEADASAIPEEKTKYTIEIDKEGVIALNGKQTSKEVLDSTLASDFEKIKAVEIRADRFSFHGMVVEVLGIVKKNGIEAVGIAVKQRQGTSG